MFADNSADKATPPASSLSDSAANIPLSSPLKHHDTAAGSSYSSTSHGRDIPEPGGSFSGPLQQVQTAEASPPRQQRKQKQYDEENVSLLSMSPDTSASSVSLFTPSRKTTASTIHGRVAYRAVPEEVEPLPVFSFSSPEQQSSSGRTISIDEEVAEARRIQGEETEGQVCSARVITIMNQDNGSYHGTSENYQAPPDFYNVPICLSPETMQESRLARDMGAEVGSSATEHLRPATPPHVRSASGMYHSSLRREVRRETKREKSQAEQVPSKEAPLTNKGDKPRKKVDWKRLSTLASVLVGFAWSAAGASQSFVTAKAVTIDFLEDEDGGNVEHFDISSMWLTSAYLLAFGIFVLPARRIQTAIVPPFVGLTAGAGWLALWSLAAGLSSYAAHNGGMALLCICRAMQGLGASFVTTNGQVILEHAGLELWLGASASVATCLGALIGTVMATLLASFDSDWRWMYFCLGAWSAALFALGLWLTHRDDYNEIYGRFREGRRLGPLWKILDLPGAALLMLSAVLSVTGWNQLGGAGFGAPYPYVLIIMGALFVVALVIWERDIQDPLLPIKDLVGADSSIALGLIMTTSIVFAVWAWYTTRIAEDVLHYSTLKTCIGVTLAAITGISASLATKTVRARVPIPMLFLASTWLLVPGLICSIGASLGNHLLALVILSLIFVPAGAVTLFRTAIYAMSAGAVSTQATPVVLSATLLSFALGLGVAGAVEKGVSESSEGEIAAFRGALYLGIGMASLGLVFAIIVLVRWLARRRSGVV